MKLIESLRVIIAEIEIKEYDIDDLSIIRMSKSLNISIKLANAIIKREGLKVSQATAISDKAIAKVTRAAMLSLKVKSKSIINPINGQTSTPIVKP